MQFILKTREELNAKMSSFFNMAGGTLDDYCPCLKEINTSKNNYSVRAVCQQLGSIIAEKSIVKLAWGQIVTSLVDHGKDLEDLESSLQTPDQKDRSWLQHEILRIKRTDVNERRKDICESKQVFMRFDIMGNQAQPWGFIGFDLMGSQAPPWGAGGVNLFPVELFNLKVQAENNGLKILPNKDEVDCCFCLYGRLIEVIIAPDINGPLLINIYSQSHKPQDCYIPRKDAGKPISFSVLTEMMKETRKGRLNSWNI
jgi:hypothetical protein